MRMLSELIMLVWLLFYGAIDGVKEAYSDWQEARYKEHKWRTARCATCTKGFRPDEAIYETGKGYQHRECHYGGLRAVK